MTTTLTEQQEIRELEPGDTFDQDTGAYLGQCETFRSFPVQIAVYLDGHYYIYKLDRKERQE